VIHTYISAILRKQQSGRWWLKANQGKKVAWSHLMWLRCLWSQLSRDLGIQNHSLKIAPGYFFTKEPKTHWRKDSLFNKLCQEDSLSNCRELKLHPYLSPCAKVNSECIKELNIRSETLKLLQKNIGRCFLESSSYLEVTGRGNYFLTRTSISLELKVQIHKWDGIKLLHIKRNNP
jgi:hypothetical protein